MASKQSEYNIINKEMLVLADKLEAISCELNEDFMGIHQDRYAAILDGYQGQYRDGSGIARSGVPTGKNDLMSDHGIMIKADLDELDSLKKQIVETRSAHDKAIANMNTGVSEMVWAGVDADMYQKMWFRIAVSSDSEIEHINKGIAIYQDVIANVRHNYSEARPSGSEGIIKIQINQLSLISNRINNVVGKTGFAKKRAGMLLDSLSDDDDLTPDQVTRLTKILAIDTGDMTVVAEKTKETAGKFEDAESENEKSRNYFLQYCEENPTGPNFRNIVSECAKLVNLEGRFEAFEIISINSDGSITYRFFTVNPDGSVTYDFDAMDEVLDEYRKNPDSISDKTAVELALVFLIMPKDIYDYYSKSKVGGYLGGYHLPLFFYEKLDSATLSDDTIELIINSVQQRYYNEYGDVDVSAFRCKYLDRSRKNGLSKYETQAIARLLVERKPNGSWLDYDEILQLFQMTNRSDRVKELGQELSKLTIEKCEDLLKGNYTTEDRLHLHDLMRCTQLVIFLGDVVESNLNEHFKINDKYRYKIGDFDFEKFRLEGVLKYKGVKYDSSDISDLFVSNGFSHYQNSVIDKYLKSIGADPDLGKDFLELLYSVFGLTDIGSILDVTLSSFGLLNDFINTIGSSSIMSEEQKTIAYYLTGQAVNLLGGAVIYVETPNGLELIGTVPTERYRDNIDILLKKDIKEQEAIEVLMFGGKVDKNKLLEKIEDHYKNLTTNN
ncbi:MAG: hypothetical protein FWF88_09335 [Peptococcaceae bacterium]|nr:hypothetical protein [Peptococcaceae bacterium]